MFDVALIIITIISIGAIIVLVSRKSSQLSKFDNKTIKRERDIVTKNDIIAQRLERKFNKLSSSAARLFRPTINKGLIIAKDAFQKVKHLEFKYRQKEMQASGGSDDHQQIITFQQVKDVDELVEKEDFSGAEKKLIEMISVDPKNVDFYVYLGEIYMRMKDYEHAHETFDFAITLTKNRIQSSEVINGTQNAELAAHYINDGLALRGANRLSEALIMMEKACQLESNNPRNLDILLETSIIAGDKLLAWESFDRLKQVNPDNNKLPLFEEQIKELEKGGNK